MSLQAVLQLCRIPNVFTAMANVLAALVLARGGAVKIGDLSLVLASACFYLAGMVLNDIFDREVDRIERPDRPIPSGRVSLRAAAVIAGVQLASGFALLWPMGASARKVGLALVAAIFLYDGLLKSTALGPLSMGACRFFNVLLGFSVVGGPVGPEWMAPVMMGLFTVAITYLARDEVPGMEQLRARTGVAFMAALYLVFTPLLMTLAPSAYWALPFVYFIWRKGMVLYLPLWDLPKPPLVGKAIGGSIMLMPVLDAAMVAGFGFPIWSLVVAALVLPATWLKRWYYLT